jgi:rubrerythrin
MVVMGEMMMTKAQLISHISRLVGIDLDAVEAYEAAIERLKDPGDKIQLGRFLEDHRRHVVELTMLVQGMGGTAPSHPTFMRVLTKGKVILGGLAGDRAVLEAMRSNEQTTTKTYGEAAARLAMPAPVTELIRRNFADEERHLAWIEQRLGASPHATAAARHI